MRTLNYLAGFAVFINIGLNLVFIPKWQALGSAVASLITQLIVSITQIVVSKNKFGFTYSLRGAFQLLSFVLGVLLISYLAHHYILNWVSSMFVFLLISSVYALSIRMFPLKQLIHIVKNE